MFAPTLKVGAEEYPRKFFMKWSEHEQLWFVGYAKSIPTNLELMNSNTVGNGSTALDATIDLVRLLDKLGK